MSVRSSVRPSVHKVVNLNYTRCVCRGGLVMHDCMQYDGIQGHGHKPLNVRNSAIFKGYFLPFIMGLANDHEFLN